MKELLPPLWNWVSQSVEKRLRSSEQFSHSLLASFSSPPCSFRDGSHFPFVALSSNLFVVYPDVLWTASVDLRAHTNDSSDVGIGRPGSLVVFFWCVVGRSPVRWRHQLVGSRTTIWDAFLGLFFGFATLPVANDGDSLFFSFRCFFLSTSLTSTSSTGIFTRHVRDYILERIHSKRCGMR